MQNYRFLTAFTPATCPVKHEKIRFQTCNSSIQSQNICRPPATRLQAPRHLYSLLQCHCSLLSICFHLRNVPSKVFTNRFQPCKASNYLANNQIHFHFTNFSIPFAQIQGKMSNFALCFVRDTKNIVGLCILESPPRQ